MTNEALAASVVREHPLLHLRGNQIERNHRHRRERAILRVLSTKGAETGPVDRRIDVLTRKTSRHDGFSPGLDQILLYRQIFPAETAPRHHYQDPSFGVGDAAVELQRLITYRLKRQRYYELDVQASQLADKIESTSASNKVLRRAIRRRDRYKKQTEWLEELSKLLPSQSGSELDWDMANPRHLTGTIPPGLDRHEQLTLGLGMRLELIAILRSAFSGGSNKMVPNDLDFERIEQLYIDQGAHLIRAQSADLADYQTLLEETINVFAGVDARSDYRVPLSGYRALVDMVAIAKRRKAKLEKKRKLLQKTGSILFGAMTARDTPQTSVELRAPRAA